MNAKTLRSEESQTRGWQYDARLECARQLRLMGFSLRQFLTVPYFIQLLISTVLGSVILQALAVHAAAQSSEGAGAGGYRFERLHCGSGGPTPIVGGLGSCDA